MEMHENTVGELNIVVSWLLVRKEEHNESSAGSAAVEVGAGMLSVEQQRARAVAVIATLRLDLGLWMLVRLIVKEACRW